MFAYDDDVPLGLGGWGRFYSISFRPVGEPHSDTTLSFLFSHFEKNRRSRNKIAKPRRMGRMLEAAVVLVLLGLCLCALPWLGMAHDMGNPFVVRGRVYCDSCRAGFETAEAAPGIAGARVRIECKERDTLQLTYSIEGVTDSTGTYHIMVTGDRQNDFCNAKLISSPLSDCAEPDPGHDHARVILTRSNGLASDTRFANAMGFLRGKPISDCSQLLKKYDETEE